MAGPPPAAAALSSFLIQALVVRWVRNRLRQGRTGLLRTLLPGTVFEQAAGQSARGPARAGIPGGGGLVARVRKAHPIGLTESARLLSRRIGALLALLAITEVVPLPSIQLSIPALFVSGWLFAAATERVAWLAVAVAVPGCAGCWLGELSGALPPGTPAGAAPRRPRTGRCLLPSEPCP